jgi:hypothetical protein
MRIVGSPVCAGGGAAGDPTDALLADQSHSIPDNLVALLGHSRAWNCSAETPPWSDVGDYFFDDILLIEIIPHSGIAHRRSQD